MDWIFSNPLLLDDYADMLVYTLPLPRYKWYEPSNFEIIKKDITELTNTLVKKFGFYQSRAFMQLL